MRRVPLVKGKTNVALLHKNILLNHLKIANLIDNEDRNTQEIAILKNSVLGI